MGRTERAENRKEIRERRSEDGKMGRTERIGNRD